MARAGTRTSHPGILRIESNRFLVRVTARHPTTKKRAEKEETIAGSLDDARKRQLEMLDELKEAVARSTLESPELRRRAQTTVTLTAYAQLWLAHLVDKDIARPAYVTTRVAYLERLVLPKLGALRVDEVDEVALEEWAIWLARQRQDNGERYARGTLDSVWGLLRSMLNKARALIGVRVEATREFRFRVGGAPAREKAHLTPEELRTLLDVIAKEADIAWAAQLWTQAVTGMRHSEVSALQVGDVDLRHGSISIRRSQVNGDVGEPKNRRSRRQVPIPAELATLLTRQVRTLDGKEGVKALLFPSTNGRHRYVGSTNKKLRAMCERAGIEKHITSHCFRHSLNDLVRRTAGEVAARSMLGHVTSEMTERYSHVDLAEKADAQRRALGALPDTGSAGSLVGIGGGDSGYLVGIGSRIRSAE
jgi:integrase